MNISKILVFRRLNNIVLYCIFMYIQLCINFV